MDSLRHEIRNAKALQTNSLRLGSSRGSPLTVVLWIEVIETEHPVTNDLTREPNKRNAHEARDNGQHQNGVGLPQKEHQLEEVGRPAVLAAVVEVAVEVAEEDLVAERLLRIHGQVDDELVVALRLGGVLEAVDGAAGDGDALPLRDDGAAGGDGLADGEHAAADDVEGLGLVAVPVRRRQGQAGSRGQPQAHDPAGGRGRVEVHGDGAGAGSGTAQNDGILRGRVCAGHVVDEKRKHGALGFPPRAAETLGSGGDGARRALVECEGRRRKACFWARLNADGTGVFRQMEELTRCRGGPIARC